MARFAVLALAVSAVFGAASASPSPVVKRQGTGRGTWYNAGLGACGVYNTNADYIVALSADIWNGGEYCGQTISITNTANGDTVQATVEDECEGCGPNDIDMTPTVFTALGEPTSVGVETVSWYFVN